MSQVLRPCSKCGVVNRIDEVRAAQSQAKCGKCASVMEGDIHYAELNGAALAKAIHTAPVPVIVDFFAPWCGPCHAFAPIFSAAAKKHAGNFIFIKVDTEASPDAGALHQVRGLPTTVVFAKGKEKARRAGAMSRPMFQQWLRDIAN